MSYYQGLSCCQWVYRFYPLTSFQVLGMTDFNFVLVNFTLVVEHYLCLSLPYLNILLQSYQTSQRLHPYQTHVVSSKFRILGLQKVIRKMQVQY